MATNLWSSSPAIVSTGMFISCRRGHSEPCAPVPARRRLLANPSGVLRRRSARCVVVELQPGEQRLGEPLVEERVDADIDDVVGELVVGGAAVGSLVSSAMPGDAPIDREAADEVRVHQRGVQAQPAAQAVADVHAEAAQRRQHVGAAAQVGAHVRAVAVPGASTTIAS